MNDKRLEQWYMIQSRLPFFIRPLWYRYAFSDMSDLKRDYRFSVLPHDEGDGWAEALRVWWQGWKDYPRAAIKRIICRHRHHPYDWRLTGREEPIWICRNCGERGL